MSNKKTVTGLHLLTFSPYDSLFLVNYYHPFKEKYHQFLNIITVCFKYCSVYFLPFDFFIKH